jgi:hypothetical protein
MSRLQLWPWLRPFLTLVMVVSLPPLIYWFGYVKSGVQAEKQLAYTTLSAVASSLEDRLKAHEGVAAKAEDAEKKAAKKAAEKSKLDHKDVDFDRQLWLQRYLGSALGTNIELTPVSPDKPTHAQHHLAIDNDSGRMYLQFGSRVKDVDGQAPISTARMPLPLQDMIPWDLVESEFDGLLLLGENATLLAQDRRLPRQSPGIPTRFKGPEARIAPLLPLGRGSGKERIDTKQAVSDAPQRAATFTSPFDFDDEVTVELAGVKYIAFTQQIRVMSSRVGAEPLPVNSRASATNPDVGALTLTVCGLIRQDRLRSEAIALSPQTLIGFGVLVALGFFFIPFLKLRFIGAHERMRARDMWLLASSVLCATALAVLLVLDWHAYGSLLLRFDGALGTFKDRAAKQLRAEAKEATDQLRACAPQLLNFQPTSGKCQISSPNPDFRLSAVLTTDQSFTYPDFDSMFATDIAGQQTHKWTRRSIAPENINLGEREYFRRALALGVAKSEPDYYFQWVVAQTTGSESGIYAMPYSNVNAHPALGVAAEPGKRAGVVAIATPMHGIVDALVPEPFQFVLLDHHGAVTFRGARGPFAGEQFFDAVSGGAALERSAHLAAPPGTYRYHGRSYRMQAVEIDELRSTLVVYYDQSVVGSLAARAFATAAVFTLFIILSMLLGAGVAVLRHGGAAMEWAWPSPRRAALYVAACLLCLLSMLLLGLAYRFLPSSAMGWLVLSAPLFAMLALGSGHVSARVERLLGGATLHPRYARRTFQAAAVMSVLALVAWPTMVVFDDAYAVQLMAQVHDSSAKWEIAAQQRDERLRESLVNVGAPLPAPKCNGSSESSTDLRCSAPNLIYATAKNQAKLLSKLGAIGVYPVCLKPLGAGSESSSPRTCSDKAPLPRSFTASVAARLTRFNESKQDWANFLESVPNSPDDDTPRRPLFAGFLTTGSDSNFTEIANRSGLIAGLLMLVGMLCLLVGSVTKYVVGMGAVTDNRVLDEAGDFDPVEGTCWLLLRPSDATLQRMKSPITARDLRDPALVVQSLQPPAAGTTLLIQHGEHRLQDETWRAALLNLLKPRADGCVVMAFEIDPLHYLVQRLRELEEELRSNDAADKEKRSRLEVECGKLRSECIHWAFALRDVHKVRSRVTVGDRLQTGPVSGTIRARIAVECGHSEPLIAIGERLLQRADLDSYSWPDIIGFVLDLAEPYYRSLWEVWSHEERLVLIHLAQDGLVNPKQLHVVQRLARRGIVTVDPRVRLMNESFESFVRSAESAERIVEWQRTGAGTSWSRLGTPLYALAAVVLAILLFAEQEIVTNMIGIATVVGGAIGSLRGIYTAMLKPIVGVPKVA